MITMFKRSFAVCLLAVAAPTGCFAAGGVAFRTITPTPSASIPALAAKIAQASVLQAGGASVVTLPWRPHAVFAIPIRQGMFTTFQFPAGETIQEFAVSSPDSVQLHVDGSAGVAMLKLVTPVASVATVITNKRVYYLRIEPVLEGSWYQGVSFSVPSDGVSAGGFGGLYVAPQRHTQGTTQALESLQAQAPIYTGAPNFDYTVTKVVNNAPFKPVAIWDNGRFTWIQFSRQLQELPAVFADGPNGLEIVNYTVHDGGRQILVNRLMGRFVLKLGKEEVEVVAGGH